MRFITRYVVPVLLLCLLYVVGMEWSGHRIPVYLLSGGQVVPLRETPIVGRTIIQVDGLPPHHVRTVFQSPRSLWVVTDMGLRLVDTEPFSARDLLYDFRFIIPLTFVYLLLGVWFLEAGRDIHLSGICFALMFALLAAMAAVSGWHLILLQPLALFLVGPALINLGLRTTGKSVPGRLMIAELLTLLFFLLLLFAGRDDPVALRRLGTTSQAFLFGGLGFTLILQLDNSIRSGRDPVERTRRWVLVIGTVFGFLLPTSLFELAPEIGIAPEIAAYMFAPYILFPASLLFGSYRIELVPYQFVLNQSIAAGLVTGLFALVYTGALFVYDALLPQGGSPWIVHLFFLLVLVFFLDPSRRSIAALVERRVFRLDTRLTESLERLAVLYSGPLTVQGAVSRFRRELAETLGVTDSQLLFCDEQFPGLKARAEGMRILSRESALWRSLRPGRILVSSYLAYGGGVRGEVYRFLSRNGCALAVGLGQGSPLHPLASVFSRRPSANAALLLGPRKDGRNFRLSEIRYLREAARLADLILRNYELLARELLQRRNRQEVFLAGKVQRTLAEGPLGEIPSVETAFFTLPAAVVSGDYLDLIRLGPNRTAFLMGDVSGHGLGTGYLASAFRSMVRSHLENGATLSETVAVLNQFLLERYRGSEFITLLAILLDTDSGRMEHINAAHPGPYLLEANAGVLTHLRDTQRLLGISPSVYHSTATVLKPGDRLFLYSDGITETFGPREETYGDETLGRFFEHHGREPLEDISHKLRADLRAFRGGDILADDTSFLALEYRPGFRPFRNIFSLFRGGARV